MKPDNAVQVNQKQMAQKVIDGALGAGKKNAGKLKSLKVKMKFGDDGDSKPIHRGQKSNG